MGIWTILGVTGRLEDRTTNEQFGNKFILKIRLRHQPSYADLSTSPPPFTETPRLEWFEAILFKDLAESTYWEWSGDLYAYQPEAATFKAWRQRYLEAYKVAAGIRTNFDYLKGSSELRVDGRPVTTRQLLASPRTGTSLSRLAARMAPSRPVVEPSNDRAKSEAVRSFIQKNVCELTVEVLDQPGIGINATSAQYSTMRKERLLRFNCGAGGLRIRAHQLLRVDVPAGQATWTRTANLGWTILTLPLNGFRISPAMAIDPEQSGFDISALELGDYNGLHFGEFR